MNDPLRGCCQGHVTYFLNFGTPSITFERVKYSIHIARFVQQCGVVCVCGLGKYYVGQKP